MQALQEADADDSPVKLEVKDIKELNSKCSADACALATKLTSASDVRCHARSLPAETNYNLQGDAAFYSEEMINSRHKLRNHTEVQASIKEWWE